MTLNSEGLEKAYKAAEQIDGEWASLQPNVVEAVISAYLSALPPVDGLEVVGWEHKLTGIIRQRGDKPSLGVADGDYEELCRVSQASSVIAGLRAERDHWKANHDQMVQRNSVCESVLTCQRIGFRPSLDMKPASPPLRKRTRGRKRRWKRSHKSKSKPISVLGPQKALRSPDKL